MSDINIKGNDFGATLKRVNPKPLDASTLFASIGDAKAYAENKGTNDYCPYFGQVVGVKGDKPYWLGGETESGGRSHFVLKPFMELTKDGITAALGYTPLQASDISGIKSKADTAYGWGDHASAGYLKMESDPVFTASQAHNITAGMIAVLNKLSLDADGHLKVDADMYATGGVSAYGMGGSGNTGGGADYVAGDYISIKGSAISLDYTSLKGKLQGDGVGRMYTSGTGITISSDVISVDGDYLDARYLTTSDLGGLASESWVTGNYLSIASAEDTYQPKSSAINTGNIGSQSVSYASSAGSVAWGNVSDRPAKLSQFTDDLGSSPTHTHGQYLTITSVQGAYLPLTGGTVGGWLHVNPYHHGNGWQGGIGLRNKSDNTYTTYITQLTAGTECMLFGTTHASTEIDFYNGIPIEGLSDDAFQGITPALKIKRNLVTIGSGLKIGDAFITYDSIKKALRISTEDGSVMNLSVGGGVTAYQ